MNAYGGVPERPGLISDSIVKQPAFLEGHGGQARTSHGSAALFLCGAGLRRLLLSPPDARGWRARGRCRSPSVSASPCEDAEAPPGAPPGHLAMPGLSCGRPGAASPKGVGGTTRRRAALCVSALSPAACVLPFPGPL